MSQTATRLPLATAGCLVLLMANPSQGMNGDNDCYAVEYILARGMQADGEGDLAPEVEEWEQVSDELSANIGWE